MTETETPTKSPIASLKKMNWKFVAKACSAVVVVFVIAELLLFTPLNRSMLNFVLFHPTQYPAGLYETKEVSGCKPVDVYFKASDGNQLHGWFIERPKARVTVLMSHGNGGNLTYRLDFIQMLLNAGASVFTYDYEGFGRSKGEIGVEFACDDAHCAYNYLVKEKKIDPSTIVLAGESLGTGVTANLASKVSCAGVILQCPFLSLRHRAVEILPIENLFPKAFYPENALDIGDVFSKKHAPLLIIGGVVDEVLPIHHADDLFALCQEPKTYIRLEKAGHTGDIHLVTSVEYQKGLQAFLASIDNSIAANLSPVRAK